MASLLAINGDRELCKKLIEVVFISVDVIKHNEACLTTNSKNLLSCLEALYMRAYNVANVQLPYTNIWENFKMP